MLSSLVWLGLFVGVEQTAHWRTPFAQPGLTADVTAVVGISKLAARVVYLQPMQRHGFGPAVQLGASVRLF